VVRFARLNLFFGGVQAVQLRDGELTGAGDPRRGGVAVEA
jgi:gamma-glutamyltranspeptidase